jgi:hypothetical protein
MGRKGKKTRNIIKNRGAEITPDVSDAFRNFLLRQKKQAQMEIKVKGYYDNEIDGEKFTEWEKEWREEKFTCANCGWEGLGEDTDVSDITLGRISIVQCPCCKEKFFGSDRERKEFAETLKRVLDPENIERERKAIREYYKK